MERNRSKRRVSRIMAGMLAIVLCFATSLTALAGTGGTATNPQEAILTKTLKFADGAGLSTPAAAFTYNFTKVSLDGSTAAADLAAMPTPAASISFTAGETSTLNTGTGMQEITKTANVLSGLAWGRTGVYEYTVVENATGFTPGAGEAMIYSQAQFTLYVVIAYDAGTNTYFPEITYTQQTVLNNGTPGGSKGDPNKNDVTNTTYNFIFENVYTKVGGSTPGTDALKITKATTGTGSDPTKAFSFTLTADDTLTGVLTPGTATYSGTLTQGGVATTVSFTADGTAYPFTLAAGDSLVIDDALAGTTFEVEETGAANYIPSYTGTVGNSAAISATGTLATNLATNTQTVGAINNEVDYTNTFDNSLIPTGILNNVVPVVALLAVVVLGFIAFAAMNRRKASR